MPTKHTVDQYMTELRQILAHGKKRIAVLLGAGAPIGINIANPGEPYQPLIPAVDGLTTQVLAMLEPAEQTVLAAATEGLGTAPNIEMILSKLRAISAALVGSANTFGACTKAQIDDLAKSICAKIGSIVNRELPPDPDKEGPYYKLASWIAGADREHGVEVFTTNYDLLLEQALEESRIPFFSGFSGFAEPFFDAGSVATNDHLPSRWARLWKLHGSLGWKTNAKGEVVAAGDRASTELIYPDHLKYDSIQKMPYVSLFDRLKDFLKTPDSLLLSCGFSYCDTHIGSVISESLNANPRASVFAFMYRTLEEEKAAKDLGKTRPNFSVFASDKAVIGGIEGQWGVGLNDANKDWIHVRETFWRKGASGGDEDGSLKLGDFSAFAQFMALAKSGVDYSSGIAAPPPAGGVS